MEDNKRDDSFDDFQETFNPSKGLRHGDDQEEVIHSSNTTLTAKTFVGNIELPSPDNSDWELVFLDMSYRIAQRSRDPSTKCGAVIATRDNQFVSWGYNGFPRGVTNFVSRWTERPVKYDYIVHSERNAVLNAVREGRSTKDCVMYLFYSTVPCEQCTLDVIQSGITKIVMGSVEFPGVGNGEFYDTESAAREMLREAGVELVYRQDWKPMYEADLGTSANEANSET